MKDSTQFENFDRTMRELMKVSHDEIKKELEAEKTTKKSKAGKKRDRRSKDNDSDIRHNGN